MTAIGVFISIELFTLPSEKQYFGGGADVTRSQY